MTKKIKVRIHAICCTIMALLWIMFAVSIWKAVYSQTGYGYSDIAIYHGLVILFGSFSIAFSSVYLSESDIDNPGNFIVTLLGGRLHRKGTIIRYQDGQLKMLAEDEFYWHGRNPYGKAKVTNPLASMTVRVKVFPIVGNVKAAEMRCKMTIKPPQDIAGLMKLEEFCSGAYDEWDQCLRVSAQSLLYDFCQEFAGELSLLFNPHRREQQEAFQRLAREFLTPKLEPMGLELAEARFDLD